MRAQLLILTLLWSAPASAAPPKTPRIGEGAQRLVAGAVRFAKRKFGPDSCLWGIEALVNVKQISEPPGPTTVWFNGFHFTFPYEEGGDESHTISMIESIGPQVRDPEQHGLAYNEYKTLSRLGSYSAGSHSMSTHHTYDKECITEMSVDSGDALYIAQQNGLISGADITYLLLLRYATLQSYEWRDPRLLGKTFWIIRENGGRVEYFVDAKTGKILLKK